MRNPANPVPNKICPSCCLIMTPPVIVIPAPPAAITYPTYLLPFFWVFVILFRSILSILPTCSFNCCILVSNAWNSVDVFIRGDNV